MCVCDGRGRIISTPTQGANVYRDGRDPKHRATAAARAGVAVTERTTIKRFKRTRKHVVGAPFAQACLVCKGDGTYAPIARFEAAEYAA